MKENQGIEKYLYEIVDIKNKCDLHGNTFGALYSVSQA